MSDEQEPELARTNPLLEVAPPVSLGSQILARANSFQDSEGRKVLLTGEPATMEDLEQLSAALEGRAWDVAINGTEEPVFHEGVVVGHKRKLHPKLMEFLLRQVAPHIYNKGQGTLHTGQKSGDGDGPRVVEAEIHASVEAVAPANVEPETNPEGGE